jgi:predicted transcriptional regulator YdeE
MCRAIFRGETEARCVYCSPMFSSSGKIALTLVLMTAPGFSQNTTPAAPAPSQTAPAMAPAPAATTAGPKIEDQESFTVVGVTVRTNNAKEAGGQGDIPQLWQNVMQNGTLEQIRDKSDDVLVVVYSDYASDHTGDYNYTLGYRVSSADKIPEGTVARTVRAGRYAVLTSDSGAPQQVIPALWQRINSLTPEQLGGTRTYQTDFETYANITDWGNLQMTAHIGVK